MASPPNELLGLKAWQTQRRNRVRRRVVSALTVFAGVAFAAALVPERFNPLVRVGFVSATDDQAARDRRATELASVVKARQGTRDTRIAPAFSNANPSPLPRPTLAAAEILCLAKAAYYEARGENFEGQVAVAQVAMNRAKSTGQTICQTTASKVGDKGGVCLFPVTCQAKGAPPETSPAWLQTQWIAEEVAAGRAWLRELEHAEFFHTFHVGPPWRHMAQRVRRIGQHIFYAPISAPPADLTMARRVVLRWDEAAMASWTTPDVELVKREHQILAATETVPTPPPQPKPIQIRAKPQPAANAPERQDRPAFSPFAIVEQR